MLKKCDFCPNEDKQKNLKRINGNWLCNDCYRKRKQKNREHLKRNILGIRKREDLEKEWREKRAEKEIIKQAQKEEKQRRKESRKQNIFQRVFKPKINKEEKVISQSYLTLNDKQFLFRKYINLGLSKREADKKVKDCVKHLEKVRDKLRNKNLTENEINIKFQEEFAKLLEQGR